MRAEDAFELDRGDFLVSTDQALLQPAAVHALLTATYWGQGLTLEAVATSLCHSLSFGLYRVSGGTDFIDEQVGLARVVTDYATFGYLCDVTVAGGWRGHGLSKLLLEAVTTHPALARIHRLTLSTRDAHRLYEPFGFRPLPQPERWLERVV